MKATLRTHRLALLGALLFGGCESTVTGGTADAPGGASARALFNSKAMPAMVACASCHNGASGPDFLKGATDDERYTNLTASAVVNFTAPDTSRILVKPDHAGTVGLPSKTADAQAVLEWLNAEKAERGTTEPPDAETTAFAPLLCGGPSGEPSCPINSIDLTPVGSAGSKVSFEYHNLGDFAYLTNVKLIAGTGGVYLEHPLFVVVDPTTGSKKPDASDSLFAVKENLMTGETLINGGTVTFKFPAGSQLQMLIKVVSAYKPDTTTPTPTGGCKKVDAFIANAKGPLTTSCNGCHGNAANASAVNALNMVGVNGTDMATLTTVCNQVLTRVNRDLPDTSSIFIAPDPATTTHTRFKFPSAAAFTTFRTALKTWITEEITAP